jgi:hypothetical protein
VQTPDVDPNDPESVFKAGRARSFTDTQLLASINEPSDGGAASVLIDNGRVVQGNHRVNEALSRMNDPFFEGVTPDSEILVNMYTDEPVAGGDEDEGGR